MRLLFPLLAALLVAGCADRPTPPPPPLDPSPDSVASAAADIATPRRTEIGPGNDPFVLDFPTDNDALFRDEGAFYASLDRERIPGLREHGWEGGRYGFVRSPAKTSRGMVLSQLHEGLDIRPLRRDARGEPTDTVRAVSSGVVAYVHRGTGSSYGRYIVVRHRWGGTPVYSLYAHLSSTAVDTADVVEVGTPLGVLGYTGRGTAQHRAHVHLEIALLLNRNFQPWFDAYYGSSNAHGIYFGKNLAGVDAAALYRAYRTDPKMSFAEFVRGRPVAYRLALPGDLPIDLLGRYPWLAEGDTAPGDTARAGAWLISFTQEGKPVRIGRQPQPVDRPEVVYVAPEIERLRLSTDGLLARGDSTYHLTRAGRAYAALLATTARGVPPWF